MIKIWPSINLFSTILLIFIGLLVYRIFAYTFVSYDCGYYLSVARDMYHGNTFFTDIAVSYNPLAILLLGIPYLFVENTTYSMHLLISLLFIILGSTMLFLILRRLKTTRQTALFLSLLYVLITLNYDGNIIMLEPFSVFFQLLALFFYLNVIQDKKVLSSLFLTGIFISLAFLSKQFGLFLLLPTGLYLLLQNKALFKRTLFLALGVLIPVIVVYLFYVSKGVDSSQFLNFILGKGVALDVGNGTGIVDSINSTGLINFLSSIIFIFLIPFHLKNNNLKKNQKLFYIMLPVSALSVFIFATYNHYFQYLTPYLIILFSVSISNTNQKLNPILKQGVFIISLGMIIFLSLKTMKFQKRNSKYLMQGLTILEQEIPRQSNVYLSRISPAFYYLLEYNSINLSKIGYTFPEYFKPETILNAMSKGDYLVLTQDYYENYKKFENQFSQKKMQLIDQDIYIFVKK